MARDGVLAFSSLGELLSCGKRSKRRKETSDGRG